MKRLTMMILSLMAVAMGMKAQVGYQIALLNTATGEARANETVTVSVTLSNSEGTAFYSETKQATTNDFGVLSLTIGNADTFANVDFSKMPFFIEVSANGTLIGKSQILSVPVAEAAKKIVPLDKSLIVGTHFIMFPYDGIRERNVYTLNKDNTGTFQLQDIDHPEHNGSIEPIKYEIVGDRIYVFFSDTDLIDVLVYIKGKMYKYNY